MVGTAWRQEKSCRLFSFLGPCGAGSLFFSDMEKNDMLFQLFSIGLIFP